MTKNFSNEDCINYLKELNKNTGRKATVITFGCQQNEADSEKIRALCVMMGYEITHEPESADLIIINTCAIRKHAEEKALSLLGRFKALKKKNPDLIIGVCGCMAAEGHVAEMLKQDFHYVSFTVDPGMLHIIPTLVYSYVTKRERSFINKTDEAKIIEGIPAVRSSGHRAWLSIMYGCNNFCSYCIVPYVRGRERSRDSSEILKEAQELVAAGYKEITLLGQNVNSYRSDISFADLLCRIADIDGDFIIRFMTSHPKDVSDELIAVMREKTPKVAPYFHLPLQSGSDRILRDMNRRYTQSAFLALADKLKAAVPGIVLSTDVIVGFPGETEEDFEDTMQVLANVQFDLVYAFIYSPREGTPAARLETQVDRIVATNRLTRLLKLQDEISASKSREYQDKLVRVLVDSVSVRDEKMIATARTDSNKLVHFEVDNDSVGYFETVKIIKTGPFDLYAEKIEKR